MEIKKISTQQTNNSLLSLRPNSFEHFVGQQSTKKVLRTAIASAIKNGHAVGHVLFHGQSGYGKTTLAGLVSHALGSTLRVVTAYAITKPADMISLLNSLEKNDILFIDEIHRLRPQVEEVLYIAMEDYCIDMVMPDGGAVRLPLEQFTLIGATTKSESLTQPLKNRFVYTFHLEQYNQQQKETIIQRYLLLNEIVCSEIEIVEDISEYVPPIPRTITTLCVQIRDYLSVYGKSDTLLLDRSNREKFKEHANVQQGGLTPIHLSYLAILQENDGQPVGLKTLASKLGISEKAIEIDIEPLLFQLSRIEKTTRGRVLL